MSNASEEREFVKCLAANPDYSRLSVERALRVVQRENLAPDHVVQDLRGIMQEVRVMGVLYEFRKLYNCCKESRSWQCSLMLILIINSTTGKYCPAE